MAMVSRGFSFHLFKMERNREKSPNISLHWDANCCAACTDEFSRSGNRKKRNTDKEDQAMLAEFWEFDRKMIHEKYKLVVNALEEQ